MGCTSGSSLQPKRGLRPLAGQSIAAEAGVSAATVSRVLKRLGLNKLSALEPAEPPGRYEREWPGALIHIDIKNLGRVDKAGHRTPRGMAQSERRLEDIRCQGHVE
jgi:Bacterial regulatory proteins, lacI family